MLRVSTIRQLWQIYASSKTFFTRRNVHPTKSQNITANLTSIVLLNAIFCIHIPYFLCLFLTNSLFLTQPVLQLTFSAIHETNLQPNDFLWSIKQCFFKIEMRTLTLHSNTVCWLFRKAECDGYGSVLQL